MSVALQPPPPLWIQWEEETLACGRGGGGSQFGRRDRHSGTLGIDNPPTVEVHGVQYTACRGNDDAKPPSEIDEGLTLAQRPSLNCFSTVILYRMEKGRNGNSMI